jgi:polysaccharide pyruvyl transferase WcaK-like protein
MLDEIWLSKLFGRKVMLYAIGVGPFRSRLGKFLIGASAKMCDLITVRSERGAELLRELGVAAEKIHVVADPAFLLQSEVPQDSELIKLLSSGSKVGVFPALGLVDDGRDLTHAHHLAAALDNLVEKKGLHFIAFPMRALKSGLDDVEISRAIKGAMKHSDHLHVYEKRLTPSELKWVAGKTMMNITVRLHAMIFSLGARVPVVAVNYEPKVSNVFETVGSPEYLVEMDDRMEHSLTKAVEHCLDNLPGYTQKICTSMIHNELAAMQTFELMQLLYCESGKAGEAYLK